MKHSQDAVKGESVVKGEGNQLQSMRYEAGSRTEPTKADMLQYLTCWLCKGVYRDAHTINECMCTYCKGCIYKYFLENPTRNKCPQCNVELGGKPLDTIVKDITLQNIADWLIPDFKQRDDKLKSDLLQKMNDKRMAKGKMPQSVIDKQKKDAAKQAEKNGPTSDINFEFKLLHFTDEDPHLIMAELPKKLKYANKNKTILTIKKHIHNYTGEPIDNIEILCKNFPVADSHSLEYVKKTKWQGGAASGSAVKVMCLMYKRKRRIFGNNK